MAGDRLRLHGAAPIGLLFGLTYARTKSLLPVVLRHACVDVLPNLAEFIETWT